MTGSGDRNGTTRWLGIALVLSLAINAFIVGTIATRIIDIRSFRRPNPPPVVDALADSNRLLRGFSKERRGELRRIVNDYRPKLKPHRDALDEARNTLADAVAADPFDLPRVEAALKAIQDIRADMRDTGRGLTIDLITAMTPAERKDLAERMDRRKKPRTKAE
jgi:uncharacterized membrane protein